jgi:hypothetical protein
MLYLVIALIALGVIAAILGLLSHNKDGSSDVISNSTATCATCNGNDPRCEQECMMEAATKPIEYFDDEELDKFKERQSDSYTDDEAEMFREVLYTMKTEEVKDWCRSLTLRHVSLPDQIKDEVMLIIAN